MMCKELKELQEEYLFLKEVDSCSLRCAIFNLEDAFKDYFAKRNNYSVFKNKYAKQSYRTNCIRSSYKGHEYSNIQINLKKKEIKLPKLGKVRIRGYRNINEISEKLKVRNMAKNHNLAKSILNIREWICRECKNKLERDINASINIMYEGIKMHYKEILS